MFEEKQEGQHDSIQVRGVERAKRQAHVDIMIRSENCDLEQEEKLK